MPLEAQNAQIQETKKNTKSQINFQQEFVFS